MPETCPEHSSLDKGSEVKGLGFEDKPSNLKVVDGRMLVSFNNLPGISNIDKKMQMIREERHLHNTEPTVELSSDVEDTPSKIAEIRKIIEDAYNEQQ